MHVHQRIELLFGGLRKGSDVAMTGIVDEMIELDAFGSGNAATFARFLPPRENRS